MSSTNDPKNRTLTIKKTFDAPVKLVWEAWTHPDHIVQWWAISKSSANGNILCPCLTAMSLFRKANIWK